MLISVKYALDAQNNVGIFSADLNPGDMTIVFKEEINGQHFQASLINEGGILYVRIVDPSREARGEVAKVRKAAQVNEVFSIGNATVMIMSIQGGENTGVTQNPVATPSDRRSGVEITGISDEITDIPNPGGAKMSAISAPPPIVPVPRLPKVPPPTSVPAPVAAPAAAPPPVPPPTNMARAPKTVGLPDPDFQKPAVAMQTQNPVVGATALKIPVPPAPVAPAPQAVGQPTPQPTPQPAPEVDEVSSIVMPDDTSNEPLRPLNMSEEIASVKNTKFQLADAADENLPDLEIEPVEQIGPDESQVVAISKLSEVQMPEVGEETAASLNIPPPPVEQEVQTASAPGIQDEILAKAQTEPGFEPDDGPELQTKPEPQPEPEAEPVAEHPQEPEQVAKGPTFPLKSVPGNTQTKAAKPVPPVPAAKPVGVTTTKINTAAPTSVKTSVSAKPTKPPPKSGPGTAVGTNAALKAKILKNFGGEEGDTFSKKMKTNLAKDVDPNALPSVQGSKLNFNPDFENQSNPLSDGDAKVVVAKRLEVPKPRSRAQLLTEDVRDRRVYVKGAKYSLRNKLAALLLFLGVAVISAYSAVVASLNDRARAWLIRDSVKAQVLLRSQEYITRLRNHHYIVNSILSLADQGRLEQSSMLRTFGSAEPLLSVGVFRQLTQTEVEVANTPPVTNLPRQLPPKIPIAPAFTPKYDLARLIKLPDGSFLEPVVQWVREMESRVLELDHNTLIGEQVKRAMESLVKTPPVLFDARTQLPRPEKGVFNFVLRPSDKSTLIAVVQTSTRYFEELFNPQNDVDFYLFRGRKELLFPERKKNDPAVAAFVQALSNGTIDPSVDNGYTGSETMPSGLDMVAKPNELNSAFTESEMKSNGIFAAFILLVFLAASLIFSKRITAPLITLVKQIESVAAGDYHTKFDVDANDEIGQVCDYFEHLSSTLRRKENELARVTDLAKKDSLTGLYNHSHFRSHLESKWKEVEAKGGSAILIDIDDFRMFNHAHGHIQGDLILKDLALGLQESVKVGITARYGGEEFVVWAPGFDQKNAFELAETIQKKIRSLKTPSLTGGTPFTVNCSIGVTNFTKGRHNNIDQFLRDADSNLVMAKKAGKNRIWAGAA